MYLQGYELIPGLPPLVRSSFGVELSALFLLCNSRLRNIQIITEHMVARIHELIA